MKCVNSGPGAYVFLLGKREKQLLIDLLRGYPRVPAEHHKLSKSAAEANAESQRLLNEALSDQRKSNKSILTAFLNDPNRFHDTGHGVSLTLSAAEFDWLLEILNDIRVGSWVALGCPEDLESVRLLTEPSPDLWFMELAGVFPMQLLHALEK
jgi:hypothetical protein